MLGASICLVITSDDITGLPKVSMVEIELDGKAVEVPQ